MKLSKEELIAKIDSLESITDEVKIELMEDITDSFEGTGEVDKEKYIEVEKYNDIVKKYKDRFMDSGSKEVKKEDEKEDEKKIIDVKEI